MKRPKHDADHETSSSSAGAIVYNYTTTSPLRLQGVHVTSLPLFTCALF